MRQKTIVMELEERLTVEVGERYILVERIYEKDGKSYFHLAPDFGGIPGNMNRNIRRYHGWRGTTNNVATYAHGLREITSIRPKNGQFRVTVGKDLHPEWD